LTPERADVHDVCPLWCSYSILFLSYEFISKLRRRSTSRPWSRRTTGANRCAVLTRGYLEARPGGGRVQIKAILIPLKSRVSPVAILVTIEVAGIGAVVVPVSITVVVAIIVPAPAVSIGATAGIAIPRAAIPGVTVAVVVPAETSAVSGIAVA
jgi:hypothetical protein